MAEARIARQKIRRRGVQVGEVAASAAGDADFLGRMPRLFEHQHRTSALAGDRGTHQTRGTGPENEDIMKIRRADCVHSTSSTSTATASFCLRDPTMMPS